MSKDKELYMPKRSNNKKMKLKFYTQTIKTMKYLANTQQNTGKTSTLKNIKCG